ncbi:MAG TPA: phage tail tape measure protein, partial [Candidatus Bathyarchaeota archaeon]|nr:phage tail tape measure protein [Candidatus Bathyarchaeota archaeon]
SASVKSYDKLSKTLQDAGKWQKFNADVMRSASGDYDKLSSTLQQTYKIQRSGSKVVQSTARNYDKLSDSLQRTHKWHRSDTESFKKAVKQYSAFGNVINKIVTESKRMADTQRAAASSFRDVNIQLEKQTNANKFLNILLNSNSRIFKEEVKSGRLAALQLKAAAEIEKRGINAVNKSLREQLKARVRQIETARLLGKELDATTKMQHSAILTVDRSLKRHGTTWGKFGLGLEKIGGMVKKVGMGFLTVLGPIFLLDAALRTVGQVASWLFDPFVSFEDALFEVRKTANLTIDQMYELGDALTKLSKDVPMAATALANIASEAGRLGISGTQNLVSFTEAVAKLSIATTLTADQAAEALAKIREAFGLPITEIENLGAVINELENTTAATTEEIVSAMKNIGAAGKMMGFTVDQAAALSATLVAAGMAGERAGTRLRRTFQQLAANASKITKFMGDQGKEWAAALERDPMEALTMYLKKLNEIPSRVERMEKAHKHFGEIAGFAIATLAENYPQLVKNMETAHEELKWGTSLQKEYSIAVTKTSAKLQVFQNRAEAARRELGEALEPSLLNVKGALVGVQEQIAKAAELIRKMNDEMESSVTATDVYIQEINRLGASVNKLPGAFEGFFSYIAVGGKTFLDFLQAAAARMGGNFVVSSYKSIDAQSAFIVGMHEMEESARDATKAFELEGKIWDQRNIALREGVKWVKIQDNVSKNNLQTIREYDEWLEIEPKLRQHITESIKDEGKRKEELTKLDMISISLARKTADAIIDEYNSRDVLTDKEFKNFKDLQNIFKETRRLGEEELGLWDKQAQARRAEIALNDETSLTYKNVVRTIEKYNKTHGTSIKIGENGVEVREALLKTGHDLIWMGDKWIIVDKNLADTWFKGNKILEDREKLTNKYLTTNEKLQIQYSRVVGAILDVIKAEVDLKTLNNELKRTFDDLTRSSRDLYGVSLDLAGAYSGMYDTWDEVKDIEEKATGVTRQIIRQYDDEVDAIERLVKQSIKYAKQGDKTAASEKIVEAAIKARIVAEKLKEKSMDAVSDSEREAYKEAWRWLTGSLRLVRDSTEGVSDLQLQWDQIVQGIASSLTKVYGVPSTLKGESDRSFKDILDMYDEVENKSKKLPKDIKDIIESAGKVETPEIDVSKTLPEKIKDAKDYADELKSSLKDLISPEDWDDVSELIDTFVSKVETIDTEKEITLDLNSEKFMEDWNEAIKQVESEPITVNIELDEDGKKLLSLFEGSLESKIKVTGIETSSKDLINSVSEGISKGVGNQTIPTLLSSPVMEIGTTPVSIPLVQTGATVTQKHQVDINVKFEGQPPKGVDRESLKEIIRTEIGKAIRSVF